jgi:hypothetical protein
MGMQDRETSNLIGSDKVEGTTVYGADRREIGSIERGMGNDTIHCHGNRSGTIRLLADT